MSNALFLMNRHIPCSSLCCLKQSSTSRACFLGHGGTLCWWHNWVLFLLLSARLCQPLVIPLLWALPWGIQGFKSPFLRVSLLLFCLWLFRLWACWMGGVLEWVNGRESRPLMWAAFVLLCLWLLRNLLLGRSVSACRLSGASTASGWACWVLGARSACLLFCVLGKMS